MEDVKGKLTFYVTFMVSFTLCISVLAMVSAFVLGLWAKESVYSALCSHIHL